MEQTALDRLIIYLENTAKDYENQIGELTGRRNGVLESLQYARTIRDNEKADAKKASSRS